MTLAFTHFAKWQKHTELLNQARTWLAHIGKHGRGSDILQISPSHCKGLQFTIAGQYTEGGTNYWESPGAFNDAMKDVILASFTQLAKDAILLMEKRTDAALLNAKNEVAAVQNAITQIEFISTEGPYPGCHHPEKCNATGRCPRDPVCFN